MRILFVVPYVPNLIRVRPFNLIRSLAARGNQITLLTLWSDPKELESLEQVRPFVQDVLAVRLPRWRTLWNVAAALPTSAPLQSAYCWEPGLARQLQGLLQGQSKAASFDAVHVEHLRGARYALLIQDLVSKQQDAPPVLWDSVDSISLLFRQAVVSARSLFSRAWTGFELGRTERYEGWLLNQFDQITVTSRKDREALLGLLPSGSKPPRIAVLPNGVDLDYFCADPLVKRDPATLIVSGKMSYHANVAMVIGLVKDVMPRVWASRPDTRLLIVGKDPVREVLALGAHPQVVVTGTVPHLPPYLQQATLAVASIAYGAGIQNKVLEAMGCATPVIASPQAVSALEARPGEEVLVAGDPESSAQVILTALEDAALCQRVGQAGRRFVEQHHHWGQVAAELEQLYRAAATRRLSEV